MLDCCQGQGELWRVLRNEFAVRAYWGVDLKPAPGRLRIDSARILALAGWPQNVVDIDTYGSPWKHWEALLKNVSQSTTVFLTIGQRVTGTVGTLSSAAIAALGLASLAKMLPKGFHVKLGRLAVKASLSQAYGRVSVIEAVEAESDNRNVRYVGVRLEPRVTT